MSDLDDALCDLLVFVRQGTVDTGHGIRVYESTIEAAIAEVRTLRAKIERVRAVRDKWEYTKFGIDATDIVRDLDAAMCDKPHDDPIYVCHACGFNPQAEAAPISPSIPEPTCEVCGFEMHEGDCPTCYLRAPERAK